MSADPIVTADAANTAHGRDLALRALALAGVDPKRVMREGFEVALLPSGRGVIRCELLLHKPEVAELTGRDE